MSAHGMGFCPGVLMMCIAAGDVWAEASHTHYPHIYTAAFISPIRYLSVPSSCGSRECSRQIYHSVTRSRLQLVPPDEFYGCGCRFQAELGAAPETPRMAAWERHFVPHTQSSPWEVGPPHCITLKPMRERPHVHATWAGRP